MSDSMADPLQLATLFRQRQAAMIDRRLKILIVIYLSLATLEDTAIFVLAWLSPDIWFRLFHASVPAGLEVALLVAHRHHHADPRPECRRKGREAVDQAAKWPDQRPG